MDLPTIAIPTTCAGSEMTPVFGALRNGRTDYEMAIAAADLVREFIGQLDMPQQLREVGVEKALLPRLAQNLLLSKVVLSNPKPVGFEGQAIAFLEGMWWLIWLFGQLCIPGQLNQSQYILSIETIVAQKTLDNSAPASNIINKYTKYIQ